MQAMPVKLLKPAIMVVLALAVFLGGCGTAEEPTSTTPTSVAVSTTVGPSTTTAGATTTVGATTTLGATTTTASPTTTTRPTGLPTLAEVEGFREWLKMNIDPIQGRTHGLTDIFISQDRQVIAPDGELVFPLPDGTVIVKEQVEGSLIAIMRKVSGIDPEHGDWQWIEYRDDGRVVGQDASCWSCHVQAKSTDWVFTLLETP